MLLRVEGCLGWDPPPRPYCGDMTTGGPYSLVGAIRLDVRTAEKDLEATRAQALVVAAHALGYRLGALVLPFAVFTAFVTGVDGTGWAQAFTVAALVTLTPLGAAFLVTFPIAFWGSLQAFWRGSRDAQIRFGSGGSVYLYYGWRYAFRRRRRPWGALSPEERRQQDSERAGVRKDPVQRNYWPH
jgi:hypothetical protein